ncbi:MAG: DUF6056 family protein [Candidatus Limiplasma sp.]|nr:DUF6056 family protein [Candidatus Limiplasma sp.]MEA5146182.1 DUF6056 family protein [Candidatus Limiplasma sp.]
MKLNRRLFYGILLLTFLPILLLNILTPMVADDYMYCYRFDNGERVQSLADIAPSMATHAQVLNGRILPHALVHLFLMLPRPVFTVLNALVYLLFLLGIYCLAKPKGIRHDWKLLLVIDGAVFLLPPIFGETYLWLTGSISYLWRDALMVWVLVAFANAVFKDVPVRGVWKTIGLAFASLYICNATENVAASILFLMVCCFGWMLYRRRRIPAALLVSFACALGSWMMLMLAPASAGNIRASASGINQIFENYQAALSLWQAHAMWPSIAYVFILFLALASPGRDMDRLAFSLGLFLCSLVCNFIMASAYYYPLRAFVGCTNFILMATAVALMGISPHWQRLLTQALASVLGLLMALQMLSALPYAYNRYQLANARAQAVVAEREAGNRDVTTFGILGKSKYDVFFALHELTTNPEYFPNVFYAKYYGLERIVVDRFEK